MNRILPALRRLPGFIAWVLAFALLAPAILGALPSPASAGEKALWADLQQSICQQTGNAGQDSEKGHVSDQCCVLCTAPAVAAPASGAELLAEAVALDLPPYISSFAIVTVTRAKLASFIAPITGRGPPA